MPELLIPTTTEVVCTPRLELRRTAAPQPRPEPLPFSRSMYCFAIISVALHFIGREHYGFFRDELYYIACGNHLAFGYVDQPPLVALVARVSALLFGSTISGYRVLPALASALLVLFTGSFTRELGGGRFAQALASLAVLFAPLYLAFGSFLSMNAFEPLFWMACAYILVRILKGADQRLWLAFGAVAGLGLQNKHTMLMFGFAMIVGMILAGRRKYMESKWFWIGGVLVLVIFLPNLIWEAQHNWPQIEVVHNAQVLKNTPTGLARFMGEQVLFLNPIALPLVAAGLGWLLFSKSGKQFRLLGWAYIIVIAAIKLLHGKSYYAMPVYPILLAAGAVVLGTFLLKSAKWLRFGYPAVLVASGLLALPFGVPILPLESLLRYQKLLSLENVVQMEHDSAGELDQLYADMLGWDNMTATVAGVYNRLSPSEQTHCAILAGNYGEAAAIDLIGRKYGLPTAISAHNNYFLWGTHGQAGEVVILFGQNAESMKTMFDDVEQAATITDLHAAPAENHLPVYVCRRPKLPLTQVWPSLRYYE